MDWSLLSCGRGGHLTYAPDEPALHAALSARTPAGEAWRCLRCGTFVPGPPSASGPAASAPAVRRGKEVRSALILRIFAIERFLRALVFGAAAFGVWRFSYSHESLEKAFDHALPAVRRLYEDFGFNFQQSKLIGLVQNALRVDSRTLRYLALGLAVYAAIEIVEGTGLWILKRWGEYFAMVATSIFLPYEVYELVNKVTALRLGAFLINLALVVYLVVAKRLFGVRGGKRAYEERLREDSILDQAEEHASAVPAEVSTPVAADLADDLEEKTPERSPAQPLTDTDPAAATPGTSVEGGPAPDQEHGSAPGQEQAATPGQENGESVAADHGTQRPGS